MHQFIMHMDIIRFLCIPLFVFLFSACSKDDEVVSCSAKSGYFEINMDGQNYVLQIDNETNFTILYGVYEVNQNAMVINGNDTDGKSIYFEGNITGPLNQGTHVLTHDNYDFFDVSVNTFDCYVSSLTFSIIQSNLIANEGVYKPIKGTFNGTAHSYPWSSGVPPSDTITFFGEFCLNGAIF